ncbi:MAG: hypothetical protein GC168_01740 [Candidatus Hydrogenedens sp.]|nr:hypothetical protein [Candidatus Hydrogenedens sp.]
MPKLNLPHMRALVPLLAGVIVLGGCIDTPPNSDPNPTRRDVAAPLRYPAGVQPFAARAADLNADGLVDLVAANRGGNSVSVLLAAGTGSYALHVDYVVGTAPSGLVVRDVNGDGVQDIMTANADSGDVSVLLGAGDGTFADESRFGLLTQGTPLDLVSGDFDQDGDIDLATADNGTNSVSLLNGTGGGAFATLPATFPVGTEPRAITAADLNGDGKLDLVTANRASNDLSLLMNDGAGGFDAAVSIAVELNPRWVAAADLDGDTDLDLLASNPGSNSLSILLNNGTGTFSAQPVVLFDLQPTRFAIGDYDKDGKLDAAVLLFGANDENVAISMNAADILYGNGTGGFDEVRRFGIGNTAQDIVAVDCDNDGRLDLLTANTGKDEVSITYGRATRRFRSDERIPTLSRPREVLSADMDDDGDEDIIVLSQEGRAVALLDNAGIDGFVETDRIAFTQTPRSMAIGYVDDDDNLDLAIAFVTGDRVTVHYGDGAGGFRIADVEIIPLTGQRPRSVAIGDMNNDGFPDLVTGNSAADRIAVILADGEGGFESPATFASQNFPLNVRLTDTNGDGNLDVIYLNRNDPDNPGDQALPRVARLLGAGDGTLVEGSLLRVETGTNPRDLELGDFTGDGLLDVAVAGTDAGAAYTHVVRNDGFVTPGTKVTAEPGARAVAFADMNHDLRDDIITANGDNTFSILYNSGGSSFNSRATWPAGLDAIEIATGDLNGDGAADILLANRLSNDISIVRGIP